MTTRGNSPREPRNPLPLTKFYQHQIVLDWKAYFFEFCGTHGDPIIDGGRLIFPDGWCYSSDDYAGPEYPPPNDPSKLVDLQIKYWKRRRQIVTVERDKLATVLKSLSGMQKERPQAPLKQVMTNWEEGENGVGGQWRSGHQEIDWFALGKSLELLNQKVEEANTELRQLGEG